jgi:hypothetical protein
MQGYLFSRARPAHEVARMFLEPSQNTAASL